jgi:uncharacterized repeat protein (TIGR03803 family)
MTRSIFVASVFFLASVASLAQTFTTLATFDGPNGAQPYRGPLVQGLDGNLYGTTYSGGANRDGEIFKITPGGALTVVKSFGDGVPALEPAAGLIQTPEGNFYGTTAFFTYSTVFWMNPEGRIVLINTFPEADDGELPQGQLVLASDGSLYGTTEVGGMHDQGTVFKVTPEGMLTTLYNFCTQANCTDGSQPIAGLILATDGNFYGTTVIGGAYSGGTIFKITPEGTLTTLYSFCAQPNCADGTGPVGGLIQSADGNLYGTTVGGGANTASCSGDCGTIFKITPAGELTTLYSFCEQKNCTDGVAPVSALVQGTDGNFYGTTLNGGGTSHLGTIFKITPQGALTTLYRFCNEANCTDGAFPYAGLFQATNGVFYGTTYAHGAGDEGTIFSLAVGLGPFVETLPTSGVVGKTIALLSQGLTGTTAVSFDGIAASFTVGSDTYLTATVPNGATTGLVTVTTPSTTLKSNQKFRVLP